ncbi:MAG: CapA family protein [Treponema sp.]|jgi:poly-gamma-glutamate synthesis protein (capsule biosynthesis protein)|nr:CapA family protein [Treponema sp.]
MIRRGERRAQSRFLKTGLCLLAVLFFFSCTLQKRITPARELPHPAGDTAGESQPPAIPLYYLTLVAAGDNLYHDPMMRPPPPGEDYDFTGNYSEIVPYIKDAGLAFINQETLLGGAEFGFSGYPRFNSPRELGAALVWAGFDIVNHANNHVMDKGEKAVFATMDYWDTVPGVRYLGIHRSEEERRRPVIVERNNIRVGFLSYTYGTNGLPVPAGKPWLVALADGKIMAEEMDALRPLCDFLVVSVHWGNEYEHSPNAAQRKTALFLAEHGADLILGHHPHVIQPVETIPKPGGGRTLCYYSLGNFLSAQDRSPRLLGALAYVRVKKEDGNTSIDNSGVIPVVTHYDTGYTNFRVYPLSDYTDDLAQRHWLRQNGKGSDISVSYFTDLAEKIFPAEILAENPFAKEE